MRMKAIPFARRAIIGGSVAMFLVAPALWYWSSRAFVGERIGGWVDWVVLTVFLAGWATAGYGFATDGSARRRLVGLLLYLSGVAFLTGPFVYAAFPSDVQVTPWEVFLDQGTDLPIIFLMGCFRQALLGVPLAVFVVTIGYTWRRW